MPGSQPTSQRIIIGLICVFLVICLSILFFYTNFLVGYFILIVLSISIFRPLFPLYCLAFLLPFFGNNPGGKHSLYAIDMLLMAQLLRWLIPYVYSSKRQIAQARSGVWLWLFLLATLISLLPIRHEIVRSYLWINHPARYVFRVFTTYGVDHYWSVRLLINLFLSILFYYFIINNISKKRDIVITGLCAFAGLFFSLILGIVDFHGIFPLTWFRPANPDIQRFGYNRLMSLFSHSGWFAEYVTILFPFFLGWLLFKPGRHRWWEIPAVLITAYAMLFTYQRAGWIAFTGAISLLALLRWQKTRQKFMNRKIAVAAVIIVLALGACLTFFLTSQLTSDMAISKRLRNLFMARDRTVIWDQAMLLYKRKPLTGVGAGNYCFYHGSVFPQDHPYFKTDKVTAHSTYLHILTERGPFALIFFLMILGTTFHRSAKAFRRFKDDPFWRGMAAGTLGALTAIALYGLAQYLFYVRIIGLLVWFSFGFSEILAGKIEEPRDHRNRKEKISIALIIILLFGLWLLNPTYNDLYFWSIYRNESGDTEFLATWADPWDEFIVRKCEGEVLETNFVAFHADAGERPVYINMIVNGEVMATALTRDRQPHDIEALLPEDMKQPLKVKFQADRPFYEGDRFPNLKYNRAPHYLIVSKNIHCRNLGLEGVGFHQWEKSAKPRFRWTSQKKAMFEIKVKSETLILQLLAANPDLNDKALQTSVIIKDASGNIISRRDATLSEKGKIKDIEFDVSGYLNEILTVEIETGRTFCMLDYGGGDSRILGVYTSEPLWK